MIFLSILFSLVPVTEELVFDAKFGPFPAGEIRLSLEEIDGIYKITCIQKTNEGISRIYRVNDRYEIWVDTTYKPLLYEARIEQGRYRKHRKIAFYHYREFAVYNDIDTVELFSGARDIFSTIYYIRMLSLSSGDTLILMLHDGKKNREMVVPVSEKKIAGKTYFVVTPFVEGLKVFGGKGLTLYYDRDMVPSILYVDLGFGHIKAARR